MKNNISFESSLAKFGIGLFETIKVIDTPIDIEFHLERMFKSIEKLEFNFNFSKDFLKNNILNYITENKISNKALRLTVFDEGFNISTRDIPYTQKHYEDGFRLNISPIRRGNSEINRHKTTNYYENIYTKKNATSNGYDDGIFLDSKDTVLECSMSNIFFIKNKEIFTPCSKLPILNGTKKRRIIEICDELNIQIEEREIKLEDIKNFDFVFVSNSLMGVMKVVQIESIKYQKQNEIYTKISKLINT
ncbi:aminotransferase class IV [Romboutsia lituseburensis]|uniref:4-amino-4-deoxychorismate lyase n=1 Tax=Romboutsia lituseburensis DSM 797 TaxID=1121325 RepID=A0A1G9L3Z5_9FIRM|nr:aminotransferase class IV [Romboutsia lituseburensis]CEH35151.1 Aminotransferase, class IV [Romboutsia lituseburensis]SDL56700.1 4-amino-4-deoxychorismate lyase [Romboutsia lituseburensis DSM 797]